MVRLEIQILHVVDEVRAGHRRRVRVRAAAVWVAAMAGTLAGCGEPPLEWPESSPFPTRSIHLGMTYVELRRARTTLYVNAEGMIEEALPASGWVHYGFTGSRDGEPDRGSTLIYVDLVEDETSRRRGETRWFTLVTDLAADLGVEPGCTVLKHGRLTLRRATLRPVHSPLAAAVEVHIETHAPGSETAGVTTRMWLPEHTSPLGDATRLPGEAVSGWLPCENMPESQPTGGPP